MAESPITLENIKAEDKLLAERFAPKMQVNTQLKRTLVSFQANKRREGFRWFKYKDPFAGSGTTLFVASNRGLDAVGIELLPIGQEIIEARKSTLNGAGAVAASILRRWRETRPWINSDDERPFPHLRITQGAFPLETERSLGRFLAQRKRR